MYELDRPENKESIFTRLIEPTQRTRIWQFFNVIVYTSSSYLPQYSFAKSHLVINRAAHLVKTGGVFPDVK